MKKGGLSLFLALALCLTLLPAAAFADSESETSTPHTHYLCGNGETCSHLGGHNEDSKTTFATAITQNNDGYVWGGGDCTQNQPNQCVLSNGGTYYPASDLVLEAPLNAQFGCIQIDGNVTLCLNGHTITVKANREAFKIWQHLQFYPHPDRLSGRRQDHPRSIVPWKQCESERRLQFHHVRRQHHRQ